MPELTFQGQRVAYLEQGAGVLLVLLHAGGSSGKQWVKTAGLLEERFRVVAPDLWWFGRTESWTGEESLTHDHQALLVARVIEEMASGPAHLVGHSYGGATALRLVLQRKDLVKTLILVEPILTPLLRLAGEEKAFREYFDMAQTFLSNAATVMARVHRLSQRPWDMAGAARGNQGALRGRDEQCRGGLSFELEQSHVARGRSSGPGPDARHVWREDHVP